MVRIEDYISQLIGLLKEQFGSRLLYIGLQGSYLRGEATKNSDIDIMAVIDEMRAADLAAYRTAIESMEHFDRSCGFICSRKDLAHWNPLEICHLLHSTKDYFGVLAELVPAYTEQDLRNFIKFSLNNLYHEICHRYIHSTPEKNRDYLPGTYKGVFFILQDLHYLRTGCFAATKAELLPLLQEKDHAVLARALELNSAETYDFDESFDLLFTWCQETLASL